MPEWPGWDVRVISPRTTERQAHICACVFAVNTVFANQHPELNTKFPEAALKIQIITPIRSSLSPPSSGS